MTTEAETHQQSNIVSFVPWAGAKTYRPEFVLFEGHKRRQWAVIERWPDGTETCFAIYRGRRSEAVSMANLWTRAEAIRRRDLGALARHPLGQQMLNMSPTERNFMIDLLQTAQRLTGYDKEVRA
jgi:hypothetical protein